MTYTDYISRLIDEELLELTESGDIKKRDYLEGLIVGVDYGISSCNLSECPYCDKIYDENDLLDDKEMFISETRCPHCEGCIHSVTRDLDCSSVHDDNCEDDCEEHCHAKNESCGLIICCACGDEIDERKSK